MKTVWVTFLVHLFSPIIAKLAAACNAGEGASLTLDNKREPLESKLLTVSGKTSCLQETVPLLNQCIIKENHGRLETDKERKTLGKDAKNRWRKISILL